MTLGEGQRRETTMACLGTGPVWPEQKPGTESLARLKAESWSPLPASVRCSSGQSHRMLAYRESVRAGSQARGASRWLRRRPGCGLHQIPASQALPWAAESELRGGRSPGSRSFGNTQVSLMQVAGPSEDQPEDPEVWSNFLTESCPRHSVPHLLSVGMTGP